jgi:hypothetical protein
VIGVGTRVVERTRRRGTPSGGFPIGSRDLPISCRGVLCGRSDMRALRRSGNLWPMSYALTMLTDTEEIKIAKLVTKAVS